MSDFLGFIAQIGITIGLNFLGVPFGIAALLGTFAMNALTPAASVEGPRKDDLEVQKSEVGGDIPIIHGRYPLMGHIAWVENDEIKEIAIKSGGDDVGPFGIFGKTPEVTEFKYTGTYLTVLAESPQDGTGLGGFHTVWMQNKLVSDKSPEAVIDTSFTGLIVLALRLSLGEGFPTPKLTFLDGNKNQKAPQRIIDDKTSALTPGFQGYGSLLVEDWPLEDYGNVIPATEVEIFEKGNTAYPYKTAPLFRNLESSGNNGIFQRKLNSLSMTSGSSGGQYNIMDPGRMIHTRSGGPVTDPGNISNAGGLNMVTDVWVDESLLQPDIGYYMGTVNNAGRLNQIDLDSGILVGQYGAAQLFPDAGDYDAFMRPRLMSSDILLGFGIPFLGGGGEPFAYRKQLHMAHNTSKIILVDPGPIQAMGLIGEYHKLDIPTSTGIEGNNIDIADKIFHNNGHMYVLHVEGGTIVINSIFAPFVNISFEGVPTLGSPISGLTILPQDSFDISSNFTNPSQYTAGSCAMTYWPDTDELIIFLINGSDVVALKWDTKTNTVTGKEIGGTFASGLTITSGGPATHIIESGVALDGQMMFEGPGTTINRLDVRNWEIEYGIMNGADFTDVSTWNATQMQSVQFWYSEDESYVGAATDNLEKLYLFRNDTNKIPLPDVITDIMTRDSFITAAELDVSDPALAATSEDVDGYPESRTDSKRNKIGKLLIAHRVDVVFVNGKITFLKRGGAITRTLFENELGAGENIGVPLTVVETQTDATDLSNHMDVTFVSPVREDEFATRTMHDKRHDDIVIARHRDTFDTPELLTENQASALAYSLLTEIYLAAQRLAFPLMPKNSDLVATDRLNVTINNKARTWRVLESVLGAGTLINELELARDDTSIYAPGVSGIPSNLTRQAPDFSGPTEIILLNLPMLTQNDNLGPIIKIALNPNLLNLDNYPGASVWLSDDAGTTWDRILDITTAPRIGHVIDGFLDDYPRWWTMDRTSTVEVFWDSGDVPTSITEAQLLEGKNLASIGEEIINFQTVVDNGDGTYALSNFLRGRFGTNDLVAGHKPGDNVVLLDSGVLSSFLFELPNVDVLRYYSAQTLGSNVTNTAVTTFTGTGRNITPISPYHFQRLRNATTQDLNLTWLRRDRDCQTWDAQGYTVLPNSESAEAYEIDIYDPNDLTGVTVLRTVTGLITPAYTYLRTNQITDGGSRRIKDLSQVLTITNGGAEDDTDGTSPPSGWTLPTGAWTSVTDTSGRPDPIEGSLIFESGIGTTISDVMEQEVDLVAGGISGATIDAEDVNMAMFFYLDGPTGNWQEPDPDRFQASFRFKDVSKIEIQTVTGPLLRPSDLNPDTFPAGQGAWSTMLEDINIQVVAGVPVNTRFVDIIFTRIPNGGNNRLYVDNVRLFWELPATASRLSADIYQISGVTQIDRGIPLRVTF